MISRYENRRTFSLTPGMGWYNRQLDNKYDIDISSYVNEKPEHVGV